MNKPVEEICKTFDQLFPVELYDLMRLRQQVFILEQSCLYLDADGFDPFAYHFMLYDQQKVLIAYSRLFGLNMPYPGHLSIGRVVIDPRFRKLSYGRFLMLKSIDRVRSLFGQLPIKIGAQAYLTAFYSSLGFKATGQRYLEDGIPHLKMVLD